MIQFKQQEDYRLLYICRNVCRYMSLGKVTYIKIEFYYWDMQCPINNEMLILLKKYSKYFDITFYNVKDDFEIVRQHQQFFLL